jgi:hypothetical protein
MNLTHRDKIITKNYVQFALITSSSPKRAIILMNYKSHKNKFEIMNYDLEVTNAILRQKILIQGKFILADELV